MTKVTASKAKTHFGALIDQAQREPVTIEKQGRPVAVVVSFETYTAQQNAQPSDDERKQALRFLEQWGKRPAISDPEGALADDPRIHPQHCGGLPGGLGRAYGFADRLPPQPGRF
ncbi:MAG: type II toxin-antitoxin system Phd/YefM family antitoxin [Verrucomicrobiales bacterium]|nr:type II toxin-antitoxin system Phd/YefM family antitoxin [Verrucomicrobiales bacterium]